MGDEFGRIEFSEFSKAILWILAIKTSRTQFRILPPEIRIGHYFRYMRKNCGLPIKAILYCFLVDISSLFYSVKLELLKLSVVVKTLGILRFEIFSITFFKVF